jgi:plastocyanin
MMRMPGTWGLVLGLLLVACGSSSNDNGGGGGGGGEAVITISNFTFSPENLEVAPGTTVRVVNNDSAPHSVTSQATEGAFTPGAVSGVSFDTGAFTGERTFTVSASAPSGTVVPYYCTVHTSGMRNSARITVK